jgi:phage tail-like protein
MRAGHARVVTHDTDFEAWANKVLRGRRGRRGKSLKDFRKDVVIELYNEAGQLALAYKVFRCWPSQYQALPDLDAAASAIAIESVVLENEGWARDTSVPEPAELQKLNGLTAGDGAECSISSGCRPW